ncbi:MAG: DNA primase [Candidatus Omnitrophica bacterium CG11_big_fil_rev_8_21_14_0_20_45_26]|uniref:DNA primase n=1 Tax=Candidatus Abzuiibacterium crystallinum TaxID=1974748 RepID=A0A2H0LNU3_9BACT|nr:MAG: DNA primase [Candidatus Omnitrophica bacterium CG11_big_fil_rev_8_21_14_0_20_45_26]PIW65656.1 MAG: DNA primase [Candidatus Omnitrophica bacterium CG12_big_fil_rev_8_21_14_0_65_45_16]
MAYDARVIEELHSLNDIVDVISSYIPLKRAGRAFKACCPFHQEKTPSFHVNPERQIFHCFGCSEGGDVIAFVMKYEKLSFPEAVQLLARRANMILPESSSEKSEKSLANVFYEIYDAAQAFYHHQFLKSDVASSARAYWKSRGFGGEEAKAFGIGYAAPDWQLLLNHLTGKGFRQDVLVKSGVIAKSNQGRFYDWFRHRLIFPIRNTQGRVIAFGGRVLNDEMPKYLNSPETDIFKKRREFYGLHLAKKALVAQGAHRYILITEGYMDCIQLQAAGFLNTVATLGTALTEEHVRILKRFADEAVLVYDGDRAGEQAALRSLDIFLTEGLSARVIGLPHGLDPDDFIRKHGKEAFAEQIKQAQDVFDFKLQALLKRYSKTDSSGLLKITSEFLDTLSKINHQVLLDRYVRRLAGVLGVEERSLRIELDKLKSKQKVSIVRNAPTIKPKAAEPPYEKLLLSYILHYPPYFAEFKQTLPHYQFQGELSRELFQSIAEALLEDAGHFSGSRFISQLPNSSLQKFVSELLVDEWSEKDREKGFRDCILKMQQVVFNQNLQDLRHRIGDAEQAGNQDLVAALMQEYKELLACSKVKSPPA